MSVQSRLLRLRVASPGGQIEGKQAAARQWPDGTIVAVGFTAKGGAKSMVALAHTKLRDRAAAENAKAYWTERLDALTALRSAR